MPFKSKDSQKKSSDPSKADASASSKSKSSSTRPETPRDSVPSAQANATATPQGKSKANGDENHQHSRNNTNETAQTDGDAAGEEWAEGLNDRLKEVSHDLPTNEALQKAGDIPIYDSSGNSRLFKTLYTGVEHIGQRQLIIFLRHFFCAGCKSYMKALLRTITPSAYFALPKPTKITIISCGHPSMISSYVAATSCPFPIYTEPSRKLYKALDLTWTIFPGKMPDYSNLTVTKLTIDSFSTCFRAGYPDMFHGGNVTQIGGEFLFEEGEPKWCHRMNRFRDHTEMEVMKRVLNMDINDEAEDNAAAAAAAADEGGAAALEPGSPNGPTRKLKLVKEKDGMKARPQNGSRAGGAG